MQFQVKSRGSREENARGAKLTEKRTRGAPCSFKCKQGLQGRKRQGRQIDGEKDERGAMQFQVKSRGSREENARGAKLTEKRRHKPIKTNKQTEKGKNGIDRGNIMEGEN